MGDGSDFASYVVARWPALARTLVLLGHTTGEAEQIAVEGLARCSPGFDRATREGDVDAWVYATVLDVRARLARRARRTPGRGAAVPAAAFPVEEPARLDLTMLDSTERDDRVALLEALEQALAALAEQEREAVVLRYVAELDTVQVADVLGVPPDVVEQRVTAALAAIDVESLRGGIR